MIVKYDEDNFSIKLYRDFVKGKLVGLMEVIPIEDLLDVWEKHKAEPNSSEKPNNCDTCRFELYWPEMCEGCCEWDSHYEPKDEPQKIGYCNECRWFRDKQVCGRCRSKNLYAPKTEPQFDKDINVCSKDEPQIFICPIQDDYEALIEDEPQTNANQHVQHVENVEPTWTKEEHEAFYMFLWNVINPNEMQDYIGMFEPKDEPQTDCPWK